MNRHIHRIYNRKQVKYSFALQREPVLIYDCYRTVHDMGPLVTSLLRFQTPNGISMLLISSKQHKA